MSWNVASGNGSAVASANWVSMLVSWRSVADALAWLSIAVEMSDAMTVLQYGAIANAVKPGPVAMSSALSYLFPATHLRTIARLSPC